MIKTVFVIILICAHVVQPKVSISTIVTGVRFQQCETSKCNINCTDMNVLAKEKKALYGLPYTTEGNTATIACENMGATKNGNRITVTYANPLLKVEYERDGCFLDINTNATKYTKVAWKTGCGLPEGYIAEEVYETQDSQRQLFQAKMANITQLIVLRLGLDLEEYGNAVTLNIKSNSDKRRRMNNNLDFTIKVERVNKEDAQKMERLLVSQKFEDALTADIQKLDPSFGKIRLKMNSSPQVAPFTSFFITALFVIMY